MVLLNNESVLKSLENKHCSMGLYFF